MKINVNLLTTQRPNVGYDPAQSPLIRVNKHDKNVNLHVCIECCFETTSIFYTLLTSASNVQIGIDIGQKSLLGNKCNQLKQNGRAIRLN